MRVTNDDSVVFSDDDSVVLSTIVSTSQPAKTKMHSINTEMLLFMEHLHNPFESVNRG